MTLYETDVAVPRPGDIGGGLWTIKQLAEITVLFGKNGSGKSLLLRGLRDTNPNIFHYVAPERTGEMNFEPGQLPEQSTGQGRRNQTSQNSIPNYRSQVITRITSYFASRGAAEQPIPARTRQFEALFGVLLPDFSIELSAKSPPYVLKRQASGATVPNVQALSSGEAQLISMALDILTVAGLWEVENRKPRILLVDEPDAHIHPDLQARLADFLVQVATIFDLQLVVATHSTSLLASLAQFSPTPASVVYFQQNVIDMQADVIDDTKRHIAACLGGHVLIGPLFGAPLLIVEGDDDFRVWSQVARHNTVSVAVLPAAGANGVIAYQGSLEKLLTSICSTPQRPLGYGLLDGDKTAPQPSAANPQAYIGFLVLACHECENLFVTDEVLAALGTNWTTALTTIQTEASKYGNKAAFLQTAPTWDRQQVDLKHVINELAMILDPKGVHWTTRIGQTIGRNKPNGTLGAFLGPEVMGAFWP
jgi:ABC-type branched-subunit amino acid transport system ATPase component